jgi:hypothetical protein
MVKDAFAAHGFKLIAMTPHVDGLSYDALFVGGKRKLIKGDIKATPEAAMANLLLKCGIKC